MRLCCVAFYAALLYIRHRTSSLVGFTGAFTCREEHVQYRLQHEIEKLKKRVLTLGAMVEEQLHQAAGAVIERNDALARRVLAGDAAIDDMEVELEEECLKLLALHQPVAVDLRFIIAVLKINNDLERIGDLVVNIGERAAVLAVKPKIGKGFDFAPMVKKVKAMLKESLDALVNMDVALARSVCQMDDEVDAIHEAVFDWVEHAIARCPAAVPLLLQTQSISRHLERIADLATNIAEDVIYMVEGHIVRHRTDELAE